MAALKILHIMDSLGVGGAEGQLVLLLRHLAREHYAHEVCHVVAQADLAPRIAGMGIPVHDLSAGGRRPVPLALVEFARIARRLAPGVIHTNGFLANLYGRLAGRVLGVPVVTTVGNVLLPPPGQIAANGDSLKRRALRTLRGYTGRRWTAHFVAITEAVKETVIRAYGVRDEHVSVVYRGLELPPIVSPPAQEIAELRAEVASADAWPVLLNVGRLAPQKGQEYLLRALPRIRAAYPHAVLLLAGAGPLEGAYRDLAGRLGVTPAVRFLGRRADVDRLLQAADIFVFPSLFEGTGIALLEAMAASKPIVASDAPAIVEVAGEAAVLGPRGDAGWLAEAVVTLASRPEQWPGLGALARRRVEERFDIAVNAAAFGMVCERVAAIASAPAGAPRMA